jgi:hypothetical protein
VITPASFPVQGEVWLGFIDSFGGTVTIQGSGAGQLWDYSNSFNVDDTTAILFDNPASAPSYMNGPVLFPNAQLVWNGAPDDSAAIFFSHNSTGFYLDGVYSQGLFSDPDINVYLDHVDFSPNQLYYPTNFQLNDIRDNTYQFGFSFPAPPPFPPATITFQQYNVQRFEADGSGTLITPLGMFNNVLRIKQSHFTIDSTFFNPPILPSEGEITSDTSYSYLFLHNQHHALLMEVSMDSSGNNVESATYYDPIVLVGGNANDKINVGFYPNPAVNEFFITHVEANSTIEFYDYAGKLVKSETLAGMGGNYRVSTHDMAAGFYLFRLSSPNKGMYYTAKFQVVK